ncbi:MAG: hypothetical protein ACTSR8_04555 [Promethearchaeota archaeon]
MTYFKLVSGFNCGIDKSVCKLGYPDYCITCISNKLKEANIIMDIFELIEHSSESKRRKMLYNQIWIKYQDILNIRHVIILSKTGMPAFNMAVMDLPIDASLLSGFIQANIVFSSESLTLIDNINPEKDFYEFEYKNFHLLLKNGKSCRICLILESKPSNNLKQLLNDFTAVFEDIYAEKIMEFEETGDLSLLEPVKALVEKSFEVTMKYPLTLSSIIPPTQIESFSLIQKAIYECIKELLRDSNSFFIPTLLTTTEKLIGVVPKEEILWYIYQMMRDNIIIWKELEYGDFNIEDQQQKKEKIFDNFKNSKALDQIFFECGEMSEKEALIKVKHFFNRGELAEKNAAYQEALNEYQKALIYAKEFNMNTFIGKISFRIMQVNQLNKNIELDFAMEQANKSEKKKDYVIALKYLFQIRDALNSEKPDGKFEKQLKKIEFRIKRIQGYFKQDT